MSGICGFAGKRDEDLLDRMISALAHRGRDVSGKMFMGGEFGLGFRGQAIGSHSDAMQPVYNESESVCVVCDGELYNWRSLRERLIEQGHVFRTDCPAEVIAHAYEQHGIVCIDLLHGGFALAIWDYHESRMIIARDRLGKKPLYYFLSQDTLLFSSCPRSIREYGEAVFTPDYRGIDGFLTDGFVSDERTLNKNIRRIPPGHMMICRQGAVRLSKYWDLASAAGRQYAEKEWLDRFGARLKEAVSERADGAGCVESTSCSYSTDIAESIASLYGNDIKIFCSQPPAGGVRKHVPVTISPGDIERLPRIAASIDDPVSDIKIIALDIALEAAANDGGVVMSAAGFERLIGADPALNVFLRMNRLIKQTPDGLRAAIRLVSKFSPGLIAGEDFARAGLNGTQGRERIKLAVGEKRLHRLYPRLFSPFTAAQRSELYSARFISGLAGLDISDPPLNLHRKDSLQKIFSSGVSDGVSRAIPSAVLLPAESLADSYGVRLRFPFMDHRLVELAVNIPGSIALNDSPARTILSGLGRNPAADPHTSLSRPALSKLCGLLDSFLNEERVAARGWFTPGAVKNVLDSAKSGCPIGVRQAVSLAGLEMWCDANNY